MAKYFSLDRLKQSKSTYMMAIGERSNGKTYSVLSEILDCYLERGEQGVLIRRYAEDLKTARGSVMFNALIQNGKLHGTEWDGIAYKSRSWYLYREINEAGDKFYDDKPFCYALALNEMEHDKSTSYPEVYNIFFDEFLTRKFYLNDEFILFMNSISTIVRQRDDVKIYMMANTVSKDAPYFTEMGITDIGTLQPGDLRTYEYGDSGLSVSIEYANTSVFHKKKSDKYFAFNNPKLQMITGGAWEVAVYKPLPVKYKPKEVIYNYFIEYNDKYYHAEIINKDGMCFTYIHNKTTPIKDIETTHIFSPKCEPYLMHNSNILNPRNNIETKILNFFKEDQVYYQDAEVGEAIRAYLQYCMKYSIIKN